MRNKLAALVTTVALAGAAVVGTTVALANREPEVKAASVGGLAPSFSLLDQDGKPVRLADFAGKIVVLEWFNNECPYVVRHYQNGDMNKTAKQYTDKGVVWLAIDSSSHHDPANAKDISAKWNISRPILSDTTGTVGKQYGAKTTPHMYVIDATGKLAYAGAIDSIRSSKVEDNAKAENHVAKALDELLAGKSVSTPETKSYGCSVKYAE